MKLVIDVDEKLVCEGFERNFTEEERDILIRAIGNSTPILTEGDLISREALKEKLNKKALDLANGGMIFIESINHIIDNAPTVAEDYDTGYQDGLEDGLNDIRPQGKWISDYRTCKCSVCNFTTVIDTYNFCPDCGADMRGKDE